MKPIPWFIGLLFTAQAFSQKSYKVVYDATRNSYATNSSIPGEVEVGIYKDFYYLFFDDSASIGFISRTEQRRARPDALKNFHHSVYSQRNSNTILNGVSYPYADKTCYISDTLKSAMIHIDSTIKKFKEWRCREAFAVTASGDTIFALLAIDYPYSYAPLGFNYFPWLAIEIYLTGNDYHLLAKEFIEWDGGKIRKHNIPVYTRGEWNRKRKM